MSEVCKTPRKLWKNKGLQNRDLTSPNLFLEGVQKPNFKYKNNYFYTLNIIKKYYTKNYSRQLLQEAKTKTEMMAWLFE